MTTFIALLNFTEEGWSNFRHTCQRADLFCQTAGKLDVKVKDLYWTLGEFDGVLVLEAPDAETATAAMLGLWSAGNVRTHTLMALDKDQMERIVSRAP